MDNALSHDAVTIARWVVVVVAACAAGVIDLKTHRIPNLLTIPILIGGYAVAASAGGIAGFVDAAVASVLLSAPYILLFLFAGGGAGDAKIMAAIGAWLGIMPGVIVLLAVALAGVVSATILLVVRTRRAQAMPPARTQMPYGVAVWAGVWAAAVGVLLWPF